MRREALSCFGEVHNPCGDRRLAYIYSGLDQLSRGFLGVLVLWPLSGLDGVTQGYKGQCCYGYEDSAFKDHPHFLSVEKE